MEKAKNLVRIDVQFSLQFENQRLNAIEIWIQSNFDIVCISPTTQKHFQVMK